MSGAGSPPAEEPRPPLHRLQNFSDEDVEAALWLLAGPVPSFNVGTASFQKEMAELMRNAEGADETSED